MAEGIQNTYILENNGYSVEVSLTETYEILTNASAVSVGLRVKSAYVTDAEYLSGSIKLDGEPLVVMDSTVSTHHIHINSLNTWYNVEKSSNAYTDSPWTKEGIAHNTDGSKEITLELELKGYGTDNYLSFRVATTKTIALTNIPRASSIGATDANIGAVSTVSVIRRVSEYTHSIAYEFGALSGYLQADGSLSSAEVKLTETSIPFLLPESFYDQIPDSPTGKCTLTARTYLGKNQIGNAQTAQFTVTASKTLCKPAISGTVEDTNAETIALTGDKNILVRYVSNALCIITATAKNGASIVSKEIGGEAVAENTRSIPSIETGTVEFRCEDSRGYGNSVAVKKTLVPYVQLTAGVVAGRTDPTSGNANLVVSGVCFNDSFGVADNVITVSYVVNSGDAVTVEAVFDGSTYVAETILTGLDYQRSHRITVTVSDKLQSVTKSVTVGKGIPVFDWDEDDFQFHVPVSVGGNTLSGVADPVKETDAVNLGVMTAALLNKAPTGFGLGTNAVAIDSLDNAAVFGLTTSKEGTPDAEQWACLTIPYSSRYATQIAWRTHMSDRTVVTASRQKYNVTWGEWDYGTGYRVEKLWENASRTSSFADQDISLDLSDYDEVMVYFCLNNYADGQNDWILSSRCPVGEILVGNFVWADDGIKYHRAAKTSATGIHFYPGYRQGVSTNAACIPYRIYGIKGVVW